MRLRTALATLAPLFALMVTAGSALAAGPAVNTCYDSHRKQSEARLSEPTRHFPQDIHAVRGLGSESDYQALLARYGIRRTDARFWAHSDALHLAYRRWDAREAGLFDYNRFENR